MAAVEPTVPADTGDRATRDCRGGALGLLSSVVIGVASTAPGYSLAASLGIVVAAVGLYAPAVLWVDVHPDALHRGRLLLHEQGRPGLRHDVLVDDEGVRAVGGLARRAGRR